MHTSRSLRTPTVTPYMLRTCTCAELHCQSIHTFVWYYILIAHYTIVLCSTAISPSGSSVFSPSPSGWQAKNSNLVLAVTSVPVMKSGKRWVTASIKVKHHCHTALWLAADRIKDLPWLMLWRQWLANCWWAVWNRFHKAIFNWVLTFLGSAYPWMNSENPDGVITIQSTLYQLFSVSMSSN